MALVSMKTESDSTAEPYEPSPYGYGLCIRLTEEQTEALGLGHVAAGTKVGITALAIVTASSEYIDADDAEEAGEDGPAHTREMQITDMSVNLEGAQPNAAAALYGDD